MLQNDFKKDQRASHFKVGFELSRQQSANLYNRNAPPLQAKPGFKTIESQPTMQQMIEKNRQTNIVYGRAAENIKTSNQAFYKWIQPVK